MIEKIELAKLFHDTYERLAPSYGYETRKETREFDENSKNGQLMIATCKEILDKYNNQPDYKSAWNELKYEYISGENKQYENNTVKQIQQKYNLGGESDK